MGRGRPKLSSSAKLLKKLPPGLKDEIDAMSSAQAKALIVEKSRDIEVVKQEERDDEQLQGAKEAVKDLGAGYKEAKTALQAAISYALLHLEGTGI